MQASTRNFTFGIFSFNSGSRCATRDPENKLRRLPGLILADQNNPATSVKQELKGEDRFR
jgi:hypothetical protein